MIPVLMWNINNEFISFTFHGNRVGFFGEFHPEYFLAELLGELAYNNPVNYVLTIIALVALIRGNKFISDMPKRLILCLTLPLIILFWFFSLTRQILPHWTSPSFVLLLIFVAAQLSDKYQIKDNYLIIPKSIIASLSVLLFVLILGVAEIKTGFIPLNFSERSKTIQRYGEGDFTLDMYGWRKIKPEFQEIREEIILKGETIFIDSYEEERMKVLLVGFGKINQIISNKDSVDVMGVVDTKKKTINGRPDIIIDFSHPNMLDEAIFYAKNNNCPLLIGTTGYSEEKMAQIKELSNFVPVLISSNFSLGINMISNFLNDNILVMDNYDKKIIEKHQFDKLDKVSGTAIMFSNLLNTKNIESRRVSKTAGEHHIILEDENEVCCIVYGRNRRRFGAFRRYRRQRKER